MTTETEGLIERRIIMRASQCGHHRKDDCPSCRSAWESNDHRIQALEAEVERLSTLQQPDELLRNLRNDLHDAFVKHDASALRNAVADALDLIEARTAPQQPGERDAEIARLREVVVMCVAEMSRARGRLETIAMCNEDRRIAASLGSTCDYCRTALQGDGEQPLPQCTDLADDACDCIDISRDDRS